MAAFLWLLASVVVLALMRVLHRKYYFLQYLFFLRYPFLIALVLLVLPVTALGAIGAPFRNLFVHEHLIALALVITVAILVAWQVMYLFGYLYEHMPQRVKLRYHRGARRTDDWVNPIPRWLERKRWRFAIFGLLAVPMVAASVWYSYVGNIVDGQSLGLQSRDVFLALIAGVAVPVALVFSLVLIDAALSRSANWDSAQERLAARKELPFWLRLPDAILRLTAKLDTVLFDQTTLELDWQTRAKRPRLFRLNLIVYFALVTFLFYVVISAFPPSADNDPNGLQWPAMLYILLLMMVLGWILPWLSFLFDRHRVMPEVALALTIFVFYNVFDTNHYYGVHYAQDGCPPSKPVDGLLQPTAHANARTRWNTLPTTRPVMVAASGGGITAAYWTNTVLAQIEQRLNFEGHPDTGFSDSVYMVSGTSGGSVGLLYYADAYAQKDGVPRRFTQQELGWITEAAGASSLASVGWGLVFRDFWRLMFPPLAERGVDRATSMEARWAQGLSANRARWADGEKGDDELSSPTLGDWAMLATNGAMPAVTFNSVLVETGELFQISSVELPLLRTGLVRARATERQFSQMFGGADIDAVTAARLSSTFPWITPSARPDLPDECDNLYHAADGGYYDNFGVISALAYNKAVKTPERKPVLIEIRASDSQNRAAPEGGDGLGIAALGPIKTLLSVRSTSQLGRNESLIEAEFPDSERIIFELRSAAPLSWHLSPAERMAIASEWDKSYNQEAFTRLCTVLGAECG